METLEPRKSETGRTSSIPTKGVFSPRAQDGAVTSPGTYRLRTQSCKTAATFGARRRRRRFHLLLTTASDRGFPGPSGCRHLYFGAAGYQSEVPATPVWLDLFARAAHSTQRNKLLTRSPGHYKRT